MNGVKFILTKYFSKSAKMVQFGSMKLNSHNLKTQSLFQKELLKYNFLYEKLK